MKLGLGDVNLVAVYFGLILETWDEELIGGDVVGRVSYLVDIDQVNQGGKENNLLGNRKLCYED